MHMYIMYYVHISEGNDVPIYGREGKYKSKYATACRRISLNWNNNYMKYLCICNLHIIISNLADPYGKYKVKINYKCSHLSWDFLVERYENI